ncbi:MAG TPA: hypothetical protein VGI39_35510 [Polyangiaceae bacterium]|jgi:hypothetical protein
MNLTRAFFTLALFTFGSSFGCAVATTDPSPEPAANETPAAAAETTVHAESRAAAPLNADSAYRGGQLCGTGRCSGFEACCHGHCYIPREDTYCLDDGEGASE